MHSRPKLIPTNFKIIAPPTGRQKHTYTIQKDSVISIIKKKSKCYFSIFFLKLLNQIMQSMSCLHNLFIHFFKNCVPLKSCADSLLVKAWTTFSYLALCLIIILWSTVFLFCSSFSSWVFTSRRTSPFYFC